MTARFFGLAVAGIAIVLTGGCSMRGAGAAPLPAEAYSNAVAAAEKRVEEGDYAGADRILSDFALKAKGTAEANEVAFWRAVFMVDPSNKSTSLGEGIRALDIYLANPQSQWYRAQAEVLRRTALTIQSLRDANGTTRIVGRDTVFVTRDQEIASLREQLARANAELERIRRRLANPSR